MHECVHVYVCVYVRNAERERKCENVRVCGGGVGVGVRHRVCGVVKCGTV